jgi:hypothetical protein
LSEAVEKEASVAPAEDVVMVEADDVKPATTPAKATKAPKEVPTAVPVAGKNKKGKERKLLPTKNDKIAKMGVVGQEARKMRIEERIKRKEQYKKDSEANCTWTVRILGGLQHGSNPR